MTGLELIYITNLEKAVADGHELRVKDRAEIERLREAINMLLECSAIRKTGTCFQCEDYARAALERKP